MYVCMHVSVFARARECGTSVCSTRCVAGCGGGWCAVHVLIRALYLECIWFTLGHGPCASVMFVCACLQVVFLSDYSVIRRVWSGYGYF